MYDETLGKLHFWLSFVGINILFFPQHFLGWQAAPAVVPDYALQFADFNMVSSIAPSLVFHSYCLCLLWTVQK